MRLITRRQIVPVLCLLFQLSFLGCAPEVGSHRNGPVLQTRDSVQSKTTRQVLSNGMVVLVHEDHSLPVMSANIIFRIGGANERPEVEGITHFLEHMLFKGTTKYKKGEIDLLTYKNGGTNNAYTDSDATQYYFTWGADRWEDAIDIMRSWMTECVFDENELNSEREVIKNSELYGRLSSQSYLLYLEMSKKLFGDHPYNHPALGNEETLKHINREQMMQYYRDYYKPNNAILVLAGDIQTDLVMEKVERLFSDIPRGAVPQTAKVISTPLTKHENVRIETSHRSQQVRVAFRTEQIGKESGYVLNVISNILATGKMSRLYQRLVEQEKVASSVWCWNDTVMYGGSFLIGAMVVPEADPVDVERIIFEEVDKLKEAFVRDEEISRASNILTSNFTFGKERVEDIAMALGKYEMLGLPTYLSTYLDKIHAVRKQDIVATAQKFFAHSNSVTGVAVPKKMTKPEQDSGAPMKHSQRREGSDISPIRESDAHMISMDRPIFYRQPKGKGGVSVPEIGEHWKVRLSNGLTLLLLRRADLPIVSIEAFVNGGYQREDASRAGVAKMVAEMLNEGTHDPVQDVTRSSDEIATTMESVGGHLTVSDTGIQIQVLRKDRRMALDLLRDLLRYPLFPKERLAQRKRLTLESIRIQNDDGQSVARNTFYANIFKGHPAQRPEIGYMETVKKITREDILSHYSTYYRPNNIIIAIAGDISPVQIVEEMKERFSSWPAREKQDLRDIPALKKQQKNQKIFMRHESRNLNIYMGHLGIRRNDPDYDTLLIADSIFGHGSGFTDRLSSTLRDQKGLAYTVWGSSTHLAGNEPGAFVCFINPPPEKQEEALRGMMDEIRTFVKSGPTDEELLNAKNHMKRKFVFRLETLADMTAYMIMAERYGLGKDYHKTFPKRVESMTKEKMITALRRHLSPDRMTVVVVGPVNEDEKTKKNNK